MMWAPVLWGTNQEAKEVKQDNIKMRTSTENLKIRKHQNEIIYFTYFPPISSKCNKEDAVRLEFKMRPSADLWEKWRILSNMRKPKNNIFSELYFDQYEVDVNAKNIRYFEEEAQPFLKVISLHVYN